MMSSLARSLKGGLLAIRKFSSNWWVLRFRIRQKIWWNPGWTSCRWTKLLWDWCGIHGHKPCPNGVSKWKNSWKAIGARREKLEASGAKFMMKPWGASFACRLSAWPKSKSKKREKPTMPSLSTGILYQIFINISMMPVWRRWSRFLIRFKT